MQAKAVTIFSDTKACFFCERSLSPTETDSMPIHVQQFIYDELCPYCGQDNSTVWAIDDIHWLKYTSKTVKDSLAAQDLYNFTDPSPIPPNFISARACLWCEAHGRVQCSCSSPITFFDFEELFLSEFQDLDNAYAHPSPSSDEEDGFARGRPFCDSCVHQGVSTCKPLREWAVDWYACDPASIAPPLIIPCIYYEFFNPHLLRDDDEEFMTYEKTNLLADKYLDSIFSSEIVDTYTDRLIAEDIVSITQGNIDSVNAPMSFKHVYCVLVALTNYLLSIEMEPIPESSPDFPHAFSEKLFDAVEMLGHIHWTDTEIEYKWLQDALAEAMSFIKQSYSPMH